MSNCKQKKNSCSTNLHPTWEEITCGLILNTLNFKVIWLWYEIKISTSQTMKCKYSEILQLLTSTQPPPLQKHACFKLILTLLLVRKNFHQHDVYFRNCAIEISILVIMYKKKNLKNWIEFFFSFLHMPSGSPFTFSPA